MRQLRDAKLKPLVEQFTTGFMVEYAMLCGQILARAHARTCDPAMLSGYVGKGLSFEDAITDAAFAYAQRNQQDYEVFRKAVRSGRLEAASVV